MCHGFDIVVERVPPLRYEINSRTPKKKESILERSNLLALLDDWCACSASCGPISIENGSKQEP